jgi:hypothetical protein
MFTGSLTGEYDSSQFTQVGMDPDSISVKGFNLWAENGNSQITELDVFGNIIKTRKKVFRIKESYQIDVPENINQFDESLGREFVKKTFYLFKDCLIHFRSSWISANATFISA